MPDAPPSPCRPVIVASHPRSGTHLTLDLLRRHFEACRIAKAPLAPLDRCYVNVDELLRAGHPLPPARASRLLARARRPPIKTHLLPDGTRLHAPEVYPGRLAEPWRALLTEAEARIYVVRDPRATLASYHEFAASWDPDARGSLGQFLRSEVGGRNRIVIWCEHVSRWRATPGVIVLRFEDIVGDPTSTLTRLAAQLDEVSEDRQPPLPPPLTSTAAARLARLRGGHPPSTATRSRSGRETGPWRDRFQPDDLDLVAAVAGELMVELGYDPSSVG